MYNGIILSENAMEEDTEPIDVDGAVENIFSNHVQENNLSDAESDSSSVAMDDVDISAPVAIRIVTTNNNTNGRFSSALSSDHNAKLKIQIIKEVKRPGKSKLFFTCNKLLIILCSLLVLMVTSGFETLPLCGSTCSNYLINILDTVTALLANKGA